MFKQFNDIRKKIIYLTVQDHFEVMKKKLVNIKMFITSTKIKLDGIF